MSYRHDHDAAVARIEALDHAVKRLERENAILKTREPVRPTRTRPWSLLATGLASLALGAVVGGAFLTETHAATPAQDSRSPIEQVSAVDPPRLARIGACTDAAKLDVTRGATHEALAELDALTTSCRTALRDLLRDPGALGADASAAATDLLAAEDTLANPTAMLVVHGAAPADGTTGQLWSEYARAAGARDVALARWKRVTL